MNTCKDCILWNPAGAYMTDKDYYGNPRTWVKDLGECMSSRMRSGDHRRLTNEKPRNRPDDADILETTQFNTGPDFGCVHWEQKHEH